MAPWDSTERAAMVALSRCTPSEKGQRDLVQRITEEGSALALLRERLGPGNLFGDPVEEAISEATQAIEAWEREGISILTMGDEHYPHRLADVFDRPPLLFARGECVPADQGVAVVGSRSVSDQGRRIATELAERLVDRALTVVSGLAAGVDTAAHRAAIRAGGRTVAVIGTGIKRAYPPENRDLHREIAEHGAVLSQFWPEQDPDKTTFPQRNGTMSGYALATIIIEASERSGTRIQARKAVEHGRPIVLLHSVVECTEWGRETAGMPDVHIARDADEAMALVDAVVDRPNEIERLLSAAVIK
jgi:DNA processing protein